jgi:hypothetical protein
MTFSRQEKKSDPESTYGPELKARHRYLAQELIHLYKQQIIQRGIWKIKTKENCNSLSCIAAFGDAMNSIGIYKIDLYIKGQKFTHPVNVINKLNDNIISIDFMHQNKLI